MSPFNDATKYMRIVALSFFVYDWACTLPAEIRLYRKQTSVFRLSRACILLILTRYIGLLALCLNLAGFFSHDFTVAGCAQYYRVMPIFQCFASWASHAVFVVRTSAICNKEAMTTISLTVLAVVVSGLELFAQLYSFRRFKKGSSGNCLIQYSDDVNIAWLYYMASTVFDIVVIGMTYRGLAMNYDARKSNRSGFNDILWNSSLLYFATTTFFNILNLAFYIVFNTSSDSTTLCALGIALTSMMSARVILNLHDYVNRPLSVSVRSSTQQSSFGNPKSFNSGAPLSPTRKTTFPAIAEESVDLDYPRRTHAAPWETHWTGQQVNKDGSIV